jgi:hypothetical protein
MTFLDIAKIALTVIASIGGGGAIVFGLSSFLGKLWADRALEKQRHEYAQMIQGKQHQLDAALKRVQMELDTLGLLHSLRTKEEFSRLSKLWKRLANLTEAFKLLTTSEPTNPASNNRLELFNTALHDTRQFFYDVQIFIPEPIEMVAAAMLSAAVKASCLNGETEGPKLTVDAIEDVTLRALDEYLFRRGELEQLIRKHVRGASLGVTERPK